MVRDKLVWIDDERFDSVNIGDWERLFAVNCESEHPFMFGWDRNLKQVTTPRGLLGEVTKYMLCAWLMQQLLRKEWVPITPDAIRKLLHYENNPELNELSMFPAFAADPRLVSNYDHKNLVRELYSREILIPSVFVTRNGKYLQGRYPELPGPEKRYINHLEYEPWWTTFARTLEAYRDEHSVIDVGYPTRIPSDSPIYTLAKALHTYQDAHEDRFEYLDRLASALTMLPQEQWERLPGAARYAADRLHFEFGCKKERAQYEKQEASAATPASPQPEIQEEKSSVTVDEALLDTTNSPPPPRPPKPDFSAVSIIVGPP